MSTAVFRREKGALFLEQVRLSSLLEAGIETPCFVYSKAQLLSDWKAYAQAVSGLDAVVAYAIKANSNPAILRLFASLGAGAVVVSDHEVRLALESGFSPTKMLLHGNGKRRRDMDAALLAGTLISVDSEFDLEQIVARATALSVTAKLLLRVNPDIDPQVHPYISTGLLQSKFGMSEAAIERLRATVAKARARMIRIDIPLMAAVALLCIPVFVSGRRISRFEGAAFVGAYAVYLGLLLVLRT